MKKIVIILILMLSNSVWAAKPVCTSHSSGDYYDFTGNISRVYINNSNVILIYFDQGVSVSEAAACGFSITNGSAALYTLDTNPDFAKLLYSTALAAHASNKQVTMQMRSVVSGYLMVDRIWIN